MTNDKRIQAGTPTGGQFAANLKADGEVDLGTAVPTDLDLIDAEIDAISDRAELGEARMFELAAAGTKTIIRADYPDAVSVVLEDTNDEGGSPMFQVVAIQDANGVDLWTDEDDEETAEVYSEYAPMLDRDLSRMDKTQHDRADPINDAYKLTF